MKNVEKEFLINKINKCQMCNIEEIEMESEIIKCQSFKGAVNKYQKLEPFVLWLFLRK
jgi:hypothetical protein